MDKLKDNFIRDITKVVPMPKSEAKQRLNEIIELEKEKSFTEGANLTGRIATEEMEEMDEKLKIPREDIKVAYTLKNGKLELVK